MKLVYHDVSDLGLVFVENERFAKKIQEMFEVLWEEAENHDIDSNHYIQDEGNKIKGV